MHVWNVLHTARLNAGCIKSPYWHHSTTLSGCIFAVEAYIDNWKKLLNNDTSSTCPHDMVNFGLLTAETYWRVWGTPANFNWFRVLAPIFGRAAITLGIGPHSRLVWSPYGKGEAIIFLPCGFFLYLYYSSFFLSSPNISGRRVDVYHTSTHGVALVRI